MDDSMIFHWSVWSVYAYRLLWRQSTETHAKAMWKSLVVVKNIEGAEGPQTATAAAAPPPPHETSVCYVKLKTTLLCCVEAPEFFLCGNDSSCTLVFFSLWFWQNAHYSWTIFYSIWSSVLTTYHIKLIQRQHQLTCIRWCRSSNTLFWFYPFKLKVVAYWHSKWWIKYFYWWRLIVFYL